MEMRFALDRYWGPQREFCSRKRNQAATFRPAAASGPRNADAASGRRGRDPERVIVPCARTTTSSAIARKRGHERAERGKRDVERFGAAP
jgi:hypothetical protein